MAKKVLWKLSSILTAALLLTVSAPAVIPAFAAETDLSVERLSTLGDLDGDGILEDIGDAADDVIDGVGDAAGDVIDGVGDAADDVIDGIGDGADDVAGDGAGDDGLGDNGGSDVLPGDGGSEDENTNRPDNTDAADNTTAPAEGSDAPATTGGDNVTDEKKDDSGFNWAGLIIGLVIAAAVVIVVVMLIPKGGAPKGKKSA